MTFFSRAFLDFMTKMTMVNGAPREALVAALSECEEKIVFHKKELERLEKEKNLLKSELLCTTEGEMSDFPSSQTDASDIEKKSSGAYRNVIPCFLMQYWAPSFPLSVMVTTVMWLERAVTFERFTAMLVAKDRHFGVAAVAESVSRAELVLDDYKLLQKNEKEKKEGLISISKKAAENGNVSLLELGSTKWRQIFRRAFSTRWNEWTYQRAGLGPIYQRSMG